MNGRRWPTSPAGRVSVTAESRGRAWRQPWLSREAEAALPFRSPGSEDSGGWRKGRQRTQARRIAKRQRQLPGRVSASKRGERSCRAEGRERPGSQPDEAERPLQFNGDRWPAIPGGTHGIGPESLGRQPGLSGKAEAAAPVSFPAAKGGSGTVVDSTVAGSASDRLRRGEDRTRDDRSGGCNQRQTMADDSGGTRKRHSGIARESLASALALPRGRGCHPVSFPRSCRSPGQNQSERPGHQPWADLTDSVIHVFL